MKILSPLSLFAFFVCLIIDQSPGHSQDNSRHSGAQLPVEVTAENFQSWRDHILPGDAEFGWQKIQWLATLKDGILAGDRENKPVLLWTMNGHPLGCT